MRRKYRPVATIAIPVNLSYWKLKNANIELIEAFGSAEFRLKPPDDTFQSPVTDVQPVNGLSS